MTLKPKTIPRGPRRPPPKLYLGQWIRRLGFSQVEIARTAGIGESHMTLIVQGKRNPSAGTLAAIADAMEMTERELRQPPPDESAVRGVAGLSPAIIARLSQNLRKN